MAYIRKQTSVLIGCQVGWGGPLVENQIPVLIFKYVHTYYEYINNEQGHRNPFWSQLQILLCKRYKYTDCQAWIIKSQIVNTLYCTWNFCIMNLMQKCINKDMLVLVQ